MPIQGNTQIHSFTHSLCHTLPPSLRNALTRSFTHFLCHSLSSNPLFLPGSLYPSLSSLSFLPCDSHTMSPLTALPLISLLTAPSPPSCTLLLPQCTSLPRVGWGFSKWSGFIITIPFYDKKPTVDILEYTPKVSIFQSVEENMVSLCGRCTVFSNPCVVCTVAVEVVLDSTLPPNPCLFCPGLSPFCCTYRKPGKLLKVLWRFVILKSDKYAALYMHTYTRKHIPA